MNTTWYHYEDSPLDYLEQTFDKWMHKRDMDIDKWDYGSSIYGEERYGTGTGIDQYWPIYEQVWAIENGLTDDFKPEPYED